MGTEFAPWLEKNKLPQNKTFKLTHKQHLTPLPFLLRFLSSPSSLYSMFHFLLFKVKQENNAKKLTSRKDNNETVVSSSRAGGPFLPRHGLGYI